MPLQNRVNPYGEIVADPARGTMMGNRGGKFHRDDQTLGKRRWATRHWICCDLYWKGNHHEPMGKGYTSLFFLDEVTALAAGHRPCFYCRRKEAQFFLSLASPPLMAHEADRIVDKERRGPRPEVEVEDLSDGAMIGTSQGAFAIRGDRLLQWSFEGYSAAIPRRSVMSAELLTPRLYVGILARGFQPRWHKSAQSLGKGIS
ncbi:MAG: hypothetical protein E6G89_03170 [Alphaproteobacteria bacterium]|nr:MAG: hypothetical protein E6G87_00095 [Alphaproteobacteria bacterium]TMJ42737.1 MAG: hypothetical protein E6G89_03170 [Alphaproteobacteria bacterium]